MGHPIASQLHMRKVWTPPKSLWASRCCSRAVVLTQPAGWYVLYSGFCVRRPGQLQPDPNEETAALLRVLIHVIDNTTFGGDVPTIPQWSGPTHTIAQVEAIIYASLAVSPSP